MRLVIADTWPIDYLILIGQIELLPRLFEKVVLQRWIASPPFWLEVVEAPIPDAPFAGLHRGETAAIAPAELLGADLLLIDERAAFRVAHSRGLRVPATLGVLDLAADRGLVDFAPAIGALEATSFRRPAAVLIF